MNTLSRLDAYVAAILTPKAESSLSTHPLSAPAGPSSSLLTSRRITGMLDSAASHLASAGESSAATLSSKPASMAGPSSLPLSDQAGPSTLSRQIPTMSPRVTRRRRRRPPTSASIKVPSPTTPLLLRVMLALWSILLAFWRSLVGDTRAVRVRRYKRRLTASRGSPAGQLSGPAGIAVDGLNGGGSTCTVVELPSAAAPSSDEGSASEAEHSDREWVGPVAVTPDTVSIVSDGPSDDEVKPRESPSDTTFSFRLRSAQNKDQVSISLSGVVETQLPAPQPLPLSLPVKNPSSILANSTGNSSPRLLPNPMGSSLLNPSVPAVPHRSISPASIQPQQPRAHQTPFHLQKTLILDLDETLIHSTSRPIGLSHGGGGIVGLSSSLFGGRGRRRGEGHAVEVVLNGRSTTYHVYKRPYVDFFLKKVASWYTLVIYTASMPEYADPVIDWLDNGRGLFAKRLYRESCYLQPNGSYIKDLALVDPDLGRVCFMDNSPISYSWNKANALPIEGWTSDPNDEALLQSIPVLDSLRFVNDVRRILGIRGFQ